MSEDVTGLLEAWSRGEPGAEDALLQAVYRELRRIAGCHFRSERTGHTLQPTAVVHEAYVRLVRQRRLEWRNREHFLAVASKMMRRVLVDHARRHRREKRGGGAEAVTIDSACELPCETASELLALHDALSALAEIDSRNASIVEMRFFGGLTVDEVSEVLGCSSVTVARQWRLARAWLSRELRGRP